MPTPIDVGGDTSNILVGSVSLYTAASGTTLPNIDGTTPIVWPAGWTQVGYTDAGVDFTYNPTIQKITVDEEMAPVLFVLNGEEATLAANLAEATLDNLALAISASTKTTAVADSTHDAITTLKFGSGSLTEIMVGFEGYSPAGLPRVCIGYRAMAQANIKQTYRRADKIITPVTFSLLADSTKTVGQRLCIIVDHTASTSS